MLHKPLLFILVIFVAVLVSPMLAAGRIQAEGQNPTPIVITLTPPVTPSPTGDGTLLPDRFEPNNDVPSSTPIGLQTETGLNLSGDDVDFYTVYLKAGQLVQVETAVYDGLDTRLQLLRDGQLLAENDDRAQNDPASRIVFTVPVDGWVVVLVQKVTVYDGRYDLSLSLLTPTATSTPLPTLTPTATTTPQPSPTPLIQPDLAEPNNTPQTARSLTPGQRGSYTLGVGDVDYFTFIAKAGSRMTCETVTDQVDTLLTVSGLSGVLGVNDDRALDRVDSALTWETAVEQPVVLKVEARGGGIGAYELACQQTAPPAPPAMPAGTHPVANIPLTVTATLTVSEPISITVQHLGRVPTETTSVTTPIRLLVYYDANNDRQPGPGEGIANVSVVAVDGQGQRIARVFTNLQGEAIFNLTVTAVARVVVPFVPGWSARVRAGETNNDIVLGLPAVRLPVFLPVQNRQAEE